MMNAMDGLAVEDRPLAGATRRSRLLRPDHFDAAGRVPPGAAIDDLLDALRGAVEHPPLRARRAPDVRRRHDATVVASRCASSVEHGADQSRARRERCVVVGLGIRLVLDARPEEAAQAVLATARHDVHVEVSDALTDDVVDRHERAVAAERRRHARRDALHALEERSDEIGGSRSAKRHDVPPRARPARDP